MLYFGDIWKTSYETRSLRRPTDRDLLFAVASQAQRGFRRRSVYQHLTLCDQLLHAGAADSRKLGCEILVQALPGAIRGDNDSHGKIGHLEGKLTLQLNTALGRHPLRRSTLQPPDQSAAYDQQNRNQLRSRHEPAEDFTASGIVAQKLDEVTLDSVENHETRPHLSIKFLTSDQPR